MLLVGLGVLWPGRGARSFDDGDCYTVLLKDLDMSTTICVRPDSSVFTRLDGLGLDVTGLRIEPDHAVLVCCIIGEDRLKRVSNRRCARAAIPVGFSNL